MNKNAQTSLPYYSRLPTVGPTVLDQTTVQFCVWAPRATAVSVEIEGKDGLPVPLVLQHHGYWQITLNDVPPGSRYWYVLNEQTRRPDPASRFQPEGVHGPSQIVDPQSFSWTDRDWQGLSLEQFIIYELHTGTFTPEGTFDAIISNLPYLRDHVGLTAIELMPVAQFPGTRNWGYDGTYLFAPQNSYGGPEGLKRLIDACHAHGLAVILDVVYNHLGPEGNYINDFGPFFTDAYRTPWGDAINYDGAESDAIRHFVISNAMYWAREFHIDALRLDAVHSIFDFSAKHILQEIGEAVHAEAAQSGRPIYVIAESDLNDSRIITPISKGGYGLDAQWSDDFHHAMHCVLTKESSGYYEDFGQFKDLATAMKDRFVYAGRYSSFRRRRHGNSSKHCSPSQFVVYAQNHDQIGNRAMGDRHSSIVRFEILKISNALVLLSPYLPLLFMGEEYGETTPFLYFIDHSDPNLIEAVRQGRNREFAAFDESQVPDPYDIQTFEGSQLQPHLETSSQQQAHLHWCRTLIDLRKSVPALGTATKGDRIQAWPHPKSQSLVIHRISQQGSEALIILSFGPKPVHITLKRPTGLWKAKLDSGAPEFGGDAQHSAPPSLHLQAHGSLSLKIPAYTAWVFVNSE